MGHHVNKRRHGSVKGNIESELKCLFSCWTHFYHLFLWMPISLFTCLSHFLSSFFFKTSKERKPWPRLVRQVDIDSKKSSNEMSSNSFPSLTLIVTFTNQGESAFYQFILWQKINVTFWDSCTRHCPLFHLLRALLLWINKWTNHWLTDSHSPLYSLGQLYFVRYKSEQTSSRVRGVTQKNS